MTYYQTGQERADSAARYSFWDRHDDEIDAMGAIRDTCINYLDDLGHMHDCTYQVAAKAKIAAVACDAANAAINLLSDRLGALQTAGDDVGIPVDLITFDLTLLQQEADTWEARWKASQIKTGG